VSAHPSDAGVPTGAPPASSANSEILNLKSQINLSLFPDISLPRAGLLATQGIRGGDNRTVLQRIKQSGDIFMAWSDKEWVLDGATVHTSIVGFDAGSEGIRVLDGDPKPIINSDLSAGFDSTCAKSLTENGQVAFQGPVKVGDFDLDLSRNAE
jgi:hypothetical protein